MDISLTKLPWYAQVGAFVVLAIGMVGLFYWQFEMPMRADIASRRTQLEAVRSDAAKAQSTAKKLPEFQAEVSDLEERLESLRAVLPEEKDAADLLRRMQTVAVQSNLTLKSFKPEAPSTKELHAEWPISLELDGTYHNLAIFFDRVGKFTRIVNISGLAIKGKDAPRPNATISASCVATTFVLLDQATQAKGAKAPKGAKAAKSPKKAA
jgi:type IV pilus assembly protein PilO